MVLIGVSRFLSFRHTHYPSPVLLITRTPPPLLCRCVVRASGSTRFRRWPEMCALDCLRLPPAATGSPRPLGKGGGDVASVSRQSHGTARAHWHWQLIMYTLTCNLYPLFSPTALAQFKLTSHPTQHEIFSRSRKTSVSSGVFRKWQWVQGAFRYAPPPPH